MARSRNIKPGFFINDELADIEPLGRLLFAGLWTVADKAGRLKDSPRKIKASILPYDDCDVNKLLDELWHKKFIVRYSVEGENYIEVLNWKKHQNPHFKEVASEIPEPDEEQMEQAPNKPQSCPSLAPVLPKSSPADSGFLIPDSLNLIPDTSTGASTLPHKPKKKHYADHVTMTEDEYEKLVNQYEEQDTLRLIEILENYKASKGKTYKSDYSAILNWVVKRLAEENQENKQKPNRPKSFDAIDQWAKMTEGLIE